MDLSWCIICDTRVDDGLTDSLYCSAKCMARDQPAAQPTTASATVITAVPAPSAAVTAAQRLHSRTFKPFGNSSSNNGNTSSSSSNNNLRFKRPVGQALTSSTWIPLYRRRRSVIRRYWPITTGQSSVLVSQDCNSHSPLLSCLEK
ncbi:hypothetical protein J3Q64DRAFT_1847887 [Phycomyces blakesleeanus]|uniref:Uncharacterized protein n=2 Tax=Phycomyces blakesleeanus TaxID=4837 RepID=A0A167L348_PHYB8|nr:hypothetical protein PHYBLDRAFT_182748 [Phycomyces blakesleeanus NRRL 1555(-)]OAD69479.1 hypothetical protein PHYBLDRAFT_182748 [Phycomyces blakesleeanus NRRL 1555(-)]|eukprot:XP_018287519.1 hypothetical protein PHYBLDRAFT_182748 [Phycomyces blakesleeanus NRRL 1555(-)]